MRHVAGLRLIHELTPNPQPLRRTVQIPRIFEATIGAPAVGPRPAMTGIAGRAQTPSWPIHGAKLVLN